MNPSQVQWSGLYYQTHVLFFPAKVNIHLSQIHLSASQEAMLIPKQGQGVMARTDPSFRIDIYSKIVSRSSLIKLWFDPDGMSFQRTQIETGGKKRIKTYRILTNGFYSREIKPDKDEGDLPPDKWSLVNDGFKIFTEMPPHGTVISEPSALFYLVSASALNMPGDERIEYIFTKHGIYQVRLHAAEYDTIKMEYEISEGGIVKTSAGKHETLSIRMSAVPLDPLEKNEFELLGLKKDIHLYMDPRTRVLLQISGRSDIVGRMDIKLKKVIF
ncbi:MAG: hypothetical protein JW932_07175 [Deltaproteobacteria bacterium]|nr:hypothetical protein [Deltaproteobacteria bacterium]